MREEHLPIEHEESTSHGGTDRSADQTAATQPRVSRDSAATDTAGSRALRAISSSLTGARNVGLLRYEIGSPPGTTFVPDSALRCDRGIWLKWPLSNLWDRQFLANLSMAVTAGGAETSAPVVHLQDSLAIVCRNELGHCRGAVIASPDPYGADSKHSAVEPSASLLELITSLALLALEIEGTKDELTRMGEIADQEAKARESFISFAAHELRSPLTSIKGFAQLLVRQSRRTTLPDTMLRSVQSIEQQSSRMSEMLGEMLDASRIRRGSLEMVYAPIDLSILVNQVVQRRRVLFPDHNFEVYGAEQAIPGVWDTGRVEQILRDLLDNAVRHSPIGSTITVSLIYDSREVTVSVRDEGTGIDEIYRPHLFEHLYRTPESVTRNMSGLGLGLFVSRYLARRLGGDLWLEYSSTLLPSGSEFRFILPLHSSDSGSMSEAGDRVH